MIMVAIYVRLSDEDKNKQFVTDESESIQNQKSMLSDYCKERNWDIYDIYCDEDYSGTDNNRPNFKRMLRDCEEGKVNIVLCKSQSRFSRDMEVIEKYIHNKFVEWDVRFIGIVDHADTLDISNKKARQINGLINEWYCEEVSENIRKTLKHKREQGQFTGSFAPYGYIVDPDNKNHLLVDKNVSSVVSDIFNWYNQGWGYRKIVMQLNQLGIVSPTAYKQQINSKYVNKNENRSSSKGLWTHSTIYTMIRNETYIGNLVQGKSHFISYKNRTKKRVPKEDWIRTLNCHEPIISQETWDKTQLKIESLIRCSPITKELSPLSGKVKCAICGKPMKRGVYYNKKRTIQYYNLTCAAYKTGAMNCSNSKTISGKSLEEVLISEINKLITGYCEFDKIQISDSQTNLAEQQERIITECQLAIETEENKLVSLYGDKLDGLITKDQYLIYSKKFMSNIKTQKTKCTNATNILQSLLVEQEKTKDRQAIISKYSLVTKLTRPIVEEFIDTVYIGEKKPDENRDITIKWNF